MDFDDFIEDGGGAAILILIAVFIIIRLIRKAKRGGFIPLIKLLNYKIGEDSSPDSLLEIEGNRTGFAAWLLDLIGMRSRHVKLLFHKNYTLQVDGRKKFTRIPARDGYGSKLGYSTSKILLILSLLTSGLSLLMLLAPGAMGFKRYSYYASESSINWEGLLVSVGICSMLALIFFWRYKKSTVIHISVTTNNKHVMGVNIKPSMEKTITKKDMEKMKDALHEGMNDSSRFYNNHYK